MPGISIMVKAIQKQNNKGKHNKGKHIAPPIIFQYYSSQIMIGGCLSLMTRENPKGFE